MNGKQVSWIIGTGASNHMTGTSNLLHDLWDIMPCTVGLPDGNNAVATKEGSLVLDGGICLENILYAPGLICNLFSVSQFMDHSNNIVSFT